LSFLFVGGKMITLFLKLTVAVLLFGLVAAIGYIVTIAMLLITKDDWTPAVKIEE